MADDSERARRREQLSPEKRALLEKRLRGKAGVEVAKPDAIPRRPDGSEPAISFAQQRLWFLEQLQPNSAMYNIAGAVRLSGPLDAGALERAVSAVVERHEVLRTSFPIGDAGEPRVVIQPRLEVPFQRADISADEDIRRFGQRESETPFDLAHGPLIRARLLRKSDTEHALLFTMHHIVSDGWSMGVLVQEVAALYHAFAGGLPSPLPALPIQYADYAAWQRAWLAKGELERQLAHWKAKLEGAPALELPTDRPRPPVQSFAGARLTFAVEEEVSARLRALGERHGASLYMVLLAAFDALLARYSGQSDIVVGTPIASRTRAETEPLIGFFVNTLVARTSVLATDTFATLLARVRDTALDAFAHQDVPFEKVVEALHLERDLSKTPLFQVMFVLQNAPPRSVTETGLTLAAITLDDTVAKFDLTCAFVEEGRTLGCVLDFSSALFDRATVERMGRHLARLLDRVTRFPEAQLSRLSFFEDGERAALLAGAHGGRLDVAEATIVDLVEAQVARSPQAVAIVDGADSLTYEELNRRANRVAHHLRARGVGPDVAVALVFPRSAEWICALLGVLKTGGAYVPIDPQAPAERRGFMLEDARVALTLEPGLSLAGPEENPSRKTGQASLAYILYTSGSTGVPKGVAVHHAGLMALVAWHRAAFGLTASDRTPQLASSVFDASGWEIWPTLASGGTLLIADDETRADPASLCSWLVEREISVGFVPTPIAERILSLPWPARSPLRALLTGGDALRRRPAAGLSFALFNNYGPTESTVVATSGPVEAGGHHERPPHIGRPIANTEAYVLDGELEPVPAGVPGELYLGGPQLARGYWQRAALTAETFVPHPFSTTPGARLYRTGDRVRALPDGNLEYLGRLDHQVKIRGLRIELGEIEARLGEVTGVAACAVDARGEGPAKRLVAYAVPRAGVRLDSSELRESLKRVLPDFMIPSAFVLLDALPLTPNGKLHRKALPEPATAVSERTFEPPEGAREGILAEIWAAVLGVPQVGRSDNFFELGGDSILSLQVIARARQRGLHLTAKQAFEHQTIAELARAARTSPLATAPQGPVTGPLELTPILLWWAERDLPHAHHFNQAIVLEAAPSVEPEHVRAAFAALLAHHDALRSRFVRTNAAVTAHVAPPEEGELPFEFLEAADSAELEGIFAGAQASLDLSRGPLARLVFVALGRGRPARILFVVHHAVVDGVSWRILLDDLLAGYQALRAREPVRLPPKTASFQQWAARLRGFRPSDDEVEYWRARPWDRIARLGIGDASGAPTDTLEVTLEAESTALLLREALAAYRLQINDLLLTALAMAVDVREGVVAVELEGHGREPLDDGGEELDLSRTVGWFTSVYPVLLDLPQGDLPARIKSVKETLRSIPRRGLGFGVLRHLSEHAAEFARFPEPEIVFNYLGQTDTAIASELFRPATEGAGPLTHAEQPRAHAFEINAIVAQGALHFAWKFALPHRAHAERMAERLLGALRELVAHCRVPGVGGFTPSDFPLARIAQADLDAIVAPFGAGRVDDLYPLSPMQHGMLFHSLDQPGAYLTQLACTLMGDLDVEAFRHAWNALARRHDVFRTAVVPERALQIVLAHAEIPVTVVDGEPPASRGFDLRQAPLARVVLVRLGEGRHRCIFTHHHLLLDGWSLPIVYGELFELYEARTSGREPVLPPAGRFRDVIAWNTAEDGGRARAFWQKTLEGFEAPTPLPLATGLRSSTYADASLVLSAADSERVLAFSRQHQRTVNTLVQAAWALLLGAYSGERDVLFGAVVAGRSAPIANVETCVGLFINTLPVRVRLDGAKNPLELSAAIQATAAEMRDFEHSPLTEITAASPLAKNTPLFESLVVFENYPLGPALAASDRALRVEDVQAVENTGYPMTLVVSAAGQITFRLTYDTGSFQRADVERLLAELGRLLTGDAARLDEGQGVRGLELSIPREETIVDRIEAQSRLHPDRVALVAGDASLTFRELDVRANQVAHWLRARDIGPESLVGLSLPRSPDLVVAMMGILKAGAAYVPIDPEYPPERRELVRTDARLACLLESLEHDALALQPVTAPARRLHPEHPAYVLYTSGSTGVPKGAVLTQRGLLNHMEWMRSAYPLAADDVVLQKTPIGFDASVWEFFAPLAEGATLVLAPPGAHRDPAALIDLVRRHGVTVLQVVPSLLRALLDEPSFGEAHSLRRVYAGGEALTPELVARFHQRTRASLCNLYGPTETTIDATSWVCPREGGPVPIGAPVANTEAWVLGPDMQLVPRGAIGELYLGGPQLARGYLARAALTAERFVPHPFAAGARLYRTGDRARLRGDGTLDYLGRVDHQVKVRGFRIELGEIEARLREVVRDAVVVARQQRLVAYVVGSASAAELRDALSKSLPEYMIPSAFVFLEALPLGPSGKVDRTALPAYEHTAAAETFVAPRTPEEELVASIWREVLGVSVVGIHDSFFDLGGHSLLATQIVSRMRIALGVEVPLRALFEAPTVAGLTKRIQGGGAAQKAIERAPRDGVLPLSFAQERLWFLDQLEPGSTAYNVPAALRLSGPLDADALEGAFGALIARHESLRTAFVAVEGKPSQRILGHVPFRLLRRSATPDTIAAEAKSDAARSFDLANPPLVRATLLRIAADDHVLLVNMHHIVSDAWSIGIFVRELAALYRNEHLSPLELQYADYASWQRRWLEAGELERQLDYWRKELRSAAPLELPLDRPRPPAQTFHGDRITLDLSEDLTARLSALGRRHGATLFMVLLSAFQALLARYSGERDVIVGTPIANRTRAETEPLIGFFTNTLALRSDVDPRGTFAELLGRVRRSTLDAYAHQDLPFEKLVDALGQPRDLSRSPIFQVLFSLVTSAGQVPVRLEGLTLTPLALANDTAKFDLSLMLEDGGARIYGTLEFNTDLFDRSTVVRIADHYLTLLSHVSRRENAVLGDVPLLAEAERARIVEGWNDTRTAYPDETCVDLFTLQVAKTPEATALVFDQRSWTYRELHQRASAIAVALRARGVGPDVVVGVCLARSLEMIAAVLGTLLAGGAYVPLDPDYPPQRLAFMLEETKPPVVLTQESLAERFTALGVATMCLDMSVAPPAGPLAPARIHPEHLAYVIYTSGSTGKPKGVSLTHRALANLVHWQLASDGARTHSRTVQFASINFDVSFQEIFATLASGKTLVVIPEGLRRDVAELLDLLTTDRTERLFLPFVGLDQLANVAEERGARLHLRDVITAGEQLRTTRAIASFFARHPETRLHNHYGPSETHVVTAYALDDDPRTWAPLPSIGRPIANTRIHILDASGAPVPIGVPGELYIGGVQLARGYWNRPDITAERFVPDPVSGEPGARLYRTGDRARYREDGTIEYLGRVDHQVKLRGFRIELGEVDAALDALDTVCESLSVVREDTPGDRRLVSYVVPSGEPPTDLRQTLRLVLPEYMVPSAFVFLDALPLTPSGKVDRRALPVPAQGGSEKDFTPPETPHEKAISAIYGEVLRVAHVGRDDDFFGLGGHSLLATQVVSRIRKAFGCELPVRAIFEHPTVAGLAAFLGGAPRTEGRAPLPALVPLRRDGGPLPVSFAQERMWFLDRLDPGKATYNMPVAMRLRGALDPATLERAFSALVDRHEALRTTFTEQEGEPAAAISPPGPFALVRSRPAPGELAEAIHREALTPFHLQRGPLFRATLFEVAPDEHVLLVVMHHIVSDGWSLSLLFDEVATLYAAFLERRPSPLEPLALTYADHAAWQRAWLAGDELQRQLDYWKTRLQGAPILDLPTDYQRPPVQTYRGAHVTRELSRDVTEALRAWCLRETATLSMGLLALFGALLVRLAGQDEVVLGLPIANRTHADTERIVGCFVNTLALRVDVRAEEKNPTFSQLLQRVRQTMLDAYAHQDLPFEQLVVELSPERDRSRNPVFQVMFNMLNISTAPNAGAPLSIPGLTMELEPMEQLVSKLDLTLYVSETPQGIHLEAVYNVDLFHAERVEEMLAQLELLVCAASLEPSSLVASTSLITGRAEPMLPADGATPPAPMWTGPIPQRIFGHAERAPEHLAVSDAHGDWTYGDLAAATRGLGSWLAREGVTRGEAVAIYAHRGASLAWALSAVLEAGAVFVVLDPRYPEKRLAQALALSKPRAWLELEAAGPPPPLLRETLDALDVRVRRSLPATAAEALASLADVQRTERAPAQPDDRAYLAFTSGTTGEPKVIAGTLQPLSHFLAWHAAAFEASDRFTMLSGLAHDPLLRDVFTPLWLGATLHVPEPDVLRSPRELSLWLERTRATAIHLTPQLVTLLVDHERPFDSLRRIYFGGDLLTAALAARVRAIAPGATLVNFYGTTETPQAMSAFIVPSRIEGKDVPIGRGIDGVELLVLNDDGRLCGVGELGEIFVRTPYLAEGYLGRSAEERFLSNPLTGDPDDRVFRTGDLGRYDTSGDVVHAGRADRQVKIRGFRVELGEIEARLSEQPMARDNAVVVREDVPGEPRLVAYVVGRDGDAGRLRDALGATLPEYMVPSAFVFLDALPLTPNGKLDKRALPAPDASRAAAPYVAPSTPLEELLVTIWQAILAVPRVGVHDGFFDLGGHSLLATRIVSRLRAAVGIELPLRAIFDHPTVAALAAAIERSRHSAEALPDLVPAPRDGSPMPLSFAQERMWFLDQLEPENAAYNLPAALRLLGPIDEDALERAFRALIARHESLRTAFVVVDGVPVQRVLPQVPFRVARGAFAESAIVAEAARPFDLTAPPLLRATLLVIGPDEHVLLVTMHHIVSDGWSLAIFVRELAALYRGDELAPLTVQYVDYAHWQRRWLEGGELERQLAYWKRELDGVPPLELPLDRPRPPVQTFRGDRVRFAFSPGLTADLKALGHRHGASLFMVLLAAFQALLARYSGQHDVVVGTPIANRTRAEIEPLIGLFVNTLALRSVIDERDTYRALLDRVRQTTLGAFAHQHLPFEKLVDALQPERDLSRTPIFQVMFVVRNAASGDVVSPDLTIIALPPAEVRAQFDLTCTFEDGDALSGALDFNTDLFERRTIERMAGHLERLLVALSQAPEATLSTLAFLDPGERAELLTHGTGRSFERTPPGVLDLFEERAARHPDLIAVTFGRTALTVGQLDARANRLASHLGDRGIGTESRVGLAMVRSLDLVVAILGVLKAGAAYVPIDPDYPLERRESIRRDAALSLVLETLDDSPPTGEPRPRARRAPDQAAYVLYTSGSTGVPKGVVISDRALANHMAWMKSVFPLQPDDVVLQKTPIGFDASVWEFFAPLVEGARLMLAPPGAHRDPAELVGLVREEGVTVLQLVPSLLRAVLEEPRFEEATSLRRVYCGGEALPADLVREFRTRSRAALCNLYGPTEATIDATYWECDGDARVVPIGRPVANTVALILDRHLAVAPPGVPGELCLGGPQLARGYLDNPAATADKFVPHPFAAGERLYRTGDRARLRADGTFEYLGRLDHQVKLRGFRIELGEIEARLSALPQVRDNVVIVREDVPGDKRIVAYVVAGGDTNAADLRAALAVALPEYMLPSAVVFLDALPLSPNGKVDRRALPIPDGGAGAASYVAPRTPLEELLAVTWQDILAIPRVGIHDGFFDLGGHSLLATRIVARLRVALGIELPLRAVFEHPTVAGLAESIERHRDAAAPRPNLVATPRDGRPLPVSFAQERMWFLDQLEPNGAAYNIPVALRLRGALDAAVLERALVALTERHEALRTTITTRNGEPHQRIADSSFALARARVPESELASALRQELLTPFDLQRGPLFRATLFELGANEHVLLVVMHHIISDGWSLALLLEEVTALYDAFARGVPSPLAPLAVQYADHAIWQRAWLAGDELRRQLDYWTSRLAGAPILDLPTDRPRPVVQTYRGARVTRALSPEVTEALHTLCRRETVTVSMGLLALFGALLARLAGQDEVVFGLPIANRTLAEAERIVGCFVNTLALRIDIRAEERHPTFSRLLQRVRRTMLDAFAHQDLPFERLVVELAPERDRSRNPIFQVMFNMLNITPRSAHVPGLSMEPEPIPQLVSKLDLTLYANETPDGLQLDAVYNADIFDAARVEGLLEQLELMVRAASDDPSVEVSSASLITPTARGVLPVPHAPPPSPTWAGGIPQRLDAHAESAPERVAVTDARGDWTYRDLASASRGLGSWLVQQGIGRGHSVAIHAHRSASLVWALLGVLDAGAAFVVLDPDYPAARLVESLALAKPSAWLQLEAAGPPPVGVCETLDALDVRVRRTLPATSSEALTALAGVERTERADAAPDDRAYLTFTSGTTGKPKIIAGTLRPLSHFLAWHAPSFDAGDRFTMLSGLAHDPLLRDVFTPIWVGATLQVPEPETLLSPYALPLWLERSRATALHLTPQLATLLLAHERPFEKIRRFYFGGDVMPPALAARIQAMAPGATLVNFYGTTETPQAIASFVIPRDGAGRHVPIGRGIEGVELLVVNEGQRLCGVGELGEIFVRTPYLAEGYLGEVEEQRFLTNPLTQRDGDRVFRTGDLGRYTPSGDVVHAGRGDRQVKIRGFRVELAEVEAALRQIPGVANAAVVARDRERLDAYVVGTPEASEGLRERLALSLPPYMIPASFTRLEAIPLTPNRKLDLARLPAPAHEVGPKVAPRDALEERLVRIWSDLLGVEAIGIHDDFFALGGHSLLAVRLLARVESELGLRAPLSFMFRNATVASLADALRAPASTMGVLLPFVSSATGDPLFCVHPVFGDASCYRDLAAALGGVYGLRARGLLSGEVPLERVEDMAALYIDTIRQVAPSGPYRIAGWSAGGVIAFEAARQLRAGGHEVSLLALFDSGAPAHPRSEEQRELADVLAAYLREAEERIAQREPVTLEDLWKVSPNSVLLAAVAFIGIEPGVPLGAADLARLATYRANVVARSHYTPPSSFDGRTLYIRAAESSRHDDVDAWRSCISGRFDVLETPGDHFSLLRPPHVGELATALRSFLLG